MVDNAVMANKGAKPILIIPSALQPNVAMGVFDGTDFYRGERVTIKAFVGKNPNQGLKYQTEKTNNWSLSEAIAIYFALNRAIYHAAKLLHMNDVELPEIYADDEFGRHVPYPDFMQKQDEPNNDNVGVSPIGFNPIEDLQPIEHEDGESFDFSKLYSSAEEESS